MELETRGTSRAVEESDAHGNKRPLARTNLPSRSKKDSDSAKKQRQEADVDGAPSSSHHDHQHPDALKAGAEEEDTEDSYNSDSEDVESDDEEDSQTESEEDEDEDPDDNTVDVTLDFFDPKEDDFHGLKALLQSYLDGTAYACSELVDTLIKQSSVGTVVKSADGSDPIGLLSVLNTQRYKDLGALAQIRNYLIQNCTNNETKTALQQAWGSSGTGLLVSERLINCPPQVAAPLQQALFDEIQWATEDEPTQELRDSFKFERYVAASRVFADLSTSAPSGNQGKKRKGAQSLIVYARPEDEFYHRRCTASYTFPTGREVAKDELQPLRLVMLLSSAQIAEARKELDEVVGNAAADQA